jgi:hypothetical protein
MRGEGLILKRAYSQTPKKTGKGMATVLGPKGTLSTPE